MKRWAHLLCAELVKSRQESNQCILKGASQYSAVSIRKLYQPHITWISLKRVWFSCLNLDPLVDNHCTFYTITFIFVYLHQQTVITLKFGGSDPSFNEYSRRGMRSRLGFRRRRRRSWLRSWISRSHLVLGREMQAAVGGPCCHLEHSLKGSERRIWLDFSPFQIKYLKLARKSSIIRVVHVKQSLHFKNLSC